MYNEILNKHIKKAIRWKALECSLSACCLLMSSMTLVQWTLACACTFCVYMSVDGFESFGVIVNSFAKQSYSKKIYQNNYISEGMFICKRRKITFYKLEFLFIELFEFAVFLTWFIRFNAAQSQNFYWEHFKQ